MSEQANLQLALSRALQTDDLSLEHDTMVVSPEITKQVADALGAVALSATGGHTPMAELARAQP